MVLDEDGDPLGGVQVRAMTPGFQRRKRTLLPGPGTATDSSGRYRLGLPPGRYVVVVTHHYHSVLRINPEVNSGDPQQRYSYGSQFYPGTDRADSATILNVQAGQEVSPIDFRLSARPNVPLRGKIVLPVGVKSVTNVSIAVIKEDLADGANGLPGVDHRIAPAYQRLNTRICGTATSPRCATARRQPRERCRSNYDSLGDGSGYRRPRGPQLESSGPHQPDDLRGAQRQAVRHHCEFRHQRLCLGVKARRANRMAITRVEAATGAPGRS